MKKLLLLGGDATLLPVIRAAKARGYYVITCDYLPDNIAHKYSDEYIGYSTTDKEAILSWSIENKIDGVLTFTDSGVVTAAYVCNRMGLACPGSYEAIEIIQNKDRFRKFLDENGCNVPKFRKYADWAPVGNDTENFRFPVLVKPVDAAGSKGVTKVCRKEDLRRAFDHAIGFSTRKEIIVEEFIDPVGPQIHGDCFVRDGKLVFIYLGDHHFDSGINNLVPVSTSWPSTHPEEELQKVERQIRMFIDKVGFMNGCMNIESRISKADRKAYLIDVGARSGGNYTPYVIRYGSGFDFVEAMLDFSMEHRPSVQTADKKGFYAYLVIHAKTDGILARVTVNEYLENKILERHDYIPVGGRVHSFRRANAAIGILIVRFPSREEMQQVTDHLDDYINVEVK